MQLRYGKLLLIDGKELERICSYVSEYRYSWNGLHVQVNFQDKEVGLFDNEGHAVSGRSFDELEL